MGDDPCKPCGPTMAERFDQLKGKLHCIFKPYFDDPCGSLAFLMSAKLCTYVMLIALCDIFMHGMAVYCAVDTYLLSEEGESNGIPRNMAEAENDMMIYNIVRTIVLDVAGLICALMLLKGAMCPDPNYIYPWLVWKLIIVIGGSIVFLVSVVVKTGMQQGLFNFLIYEGLFVLVNLAFFLVTYAFALQLDKDAKCDDPCAAGGENGGGGGGGADDADAGDEFMAPPTISESGYPPQGYVKMLVCNWRGEEK